LFNKISRLLIIAIMLQFLCNANQASAEGGATAAPAGGAMGGGVGAAAMGAAPSASGTFGATTAPALSGNSGMVGNQPGNNAAMLQQSGVITTQSSITKLSGQPTQLQQGQAQQVQQPTSAPEQNALQKNVLATTGAEAVELSTLEQAMSTDAGEADKSTPQRPKFKPLQQFGYSFFRAGSDSFAPQTDLPVAPDYILGTGDRINLTVWGSMEGNYELEINRNGEVTLPKVGTIKLSGTRFQLLPQLLKGQLGKVFKDFNLNVTMGKLRQIKVYVVGEVKTPGDYSISSMSTLINALSTAGGPTRNGTLRSIAIRRNGILVDTVDLYEFFLKGDKSRDIRLQSGDTIFVPTIGAVAGITGNVRRPAIYELKQEKSLKELLALADGIIPTGYLQRLQISRVDAHQKKSVTDVNLDPGTNGSSIETIAATIEIKDMDMVKIFPIDSTLRGYVRLDGYVLRPGDYAIKAGMKLSDILSQDNLLPEYHQSIGRITRLMPPDYHPEMILFTPAKAVAKQNGYDLALHEFDIVQMYSRWEMEEMPTVRISGDVQKPGTYRLFQKMTVRDLVYSAGNVKLTAYLNNAELIRTIRNGERVSNTTTTIDLSKALAGDPQNNLLLEPFDEFSVRRIPNWAEETDRYVTLQGEFLFPGTYPIMRGERLSSIIRRAGGFSDKAYPRAAKFTRMTVKARQQQQMDEAIARLDEQISQQQASLATTASSPEDLAAAKAGLAGLQTTISKMKALKAEGRMLIRISNPDQLTGSADDVVLEGGDQLLIPQQPVTVSVLGKVFNPTNPLVRPGATTADYLSMSGGLSNDAESSEMYVLRADGSVESRQQDFWLTSLFGGGLMGKTLEAGDTIVVPPRIEKTAWLRDIKDITTVLSQIAITAGTVLLGLR